MKLAKKCMRTASPIAKVPRHGFRPAEQNPAEPLRRLEMHQMMPNPFLYSPRIGKSSVLVSTLRKIVAAHAMPPLLLHHEFTKSGRILTKTRG